jgi:hypothetical protein
VTPRRTIAVAALTLVAVVASPFAAGVITGLLAGNNSTFGHALWHLLWAVLTVPVALGIRRFWRAWPAMGLTERDPVLAQWLAIALAAGQFLAGAGAITYSAIVHAAGEGSAIGSFLGLLFVCLYVLGVGVRGALRPTAHPS